jgi:hypothetical protein
MSHLRPSPKALAALLAAAFAASVAWSQPAPPLATDPDLEPQVTIIRRESETVEEVRIGGELRFVKVTPRHGVPYYLIPDPNGQQFIRRNSLDITVRVPLWVLLSW